MAEKTNKNASLKMLFKKSVSKKGKRKQENKKSKKQEKLKKISGKMSFNKLLEKYPKAGEILILKGMSCVGCPMAMQESLEMGAKAHGIDVKKLVNELNKKLIKSKK